MRKRPAMWLALPIILTLSSPAIAEIGDPIHGLSTTEEQSFRDGRAAFETTEGPEDGLGPVFNDTSCVACHNAGATGGGSATLETRFGTLDNGAFDPLASRGGSLIQTTGIGVAGTCTFVGEVVPPQATIVAQRRTTPLFGLGLVEAVPDASLIALAQREARRTPASAGRVSRVTDLVTGKEAIGRFGWKGQNPNLLQFSADAYLNEMGVTTPLFPDENCPQGDCSLLACDPVPGVDDDMEDVELFGDFMRLLAPPDRVAVRAQARAARPQGGRQERGPRLFATTGCAACHTPSLTTGDSTVAALSHRSFRPYSDFLLHDMGSLGDGIEQADASGQEMRTAPLWGLRFLTTYLHDGRAKTIEEAILAHAGQGLAARDRFAALSTQRKAALLAFLGAL